jgi:hypothetical protein
LHEVFVLQWKAPQRRFPIPARRPAKTFTTGNALWRFVAAQDGRHDSKLPRTPPRRAAEIECRRVALKACRALSLWLLRP